MKRLILLLSFLSLLLTPLATCAQDTAASWPPDPKTIFADGVEIVETQIINSSPIPENTMPVTDDQARVVRVYDSKSGVWHEYPYPSEITVLSNSFHVRSDGRIVFDSGLPMDTREVWILDPQTSEFSRAEIVCGARVKDLPNEGEWIFQLGTDSKTRLCFTETGEMSDPLPNDADWSHVSDLGISGIVPSLSPDGKMVAVMGFKIERDLSITYPLVYSYDIARHSFRYLGTIDRYDHNDETYFAEWVSNVRGTISNGPSQNGMSNDYFTFDITETNSLKLIVTGWMYDFYHDPPHYEYVTTTAFLENESGARMSSHNPCQFLLYDASGAHDFTLGYDCSRGNVLRAGNGYLYVRIDHNPSSSSTLVHLDTDTGKLNEILSGEIETIESVSPDGRYTLLGMDNNHHIDVVDYYFEPDWYDWKSLPGAYLAIFDTLKRTYVFQTEVYNGAEITWIDNNLLLLLAYRVSRTPSETIPDTLYLIDLQRDAPVVSKIEGVSEANSDLISPDGGSIIATMAGTSGIAVVSFKSHLATPLLNPLPKNQYEPAIKWINSGLLEISVRPIITANYWHVDTSRLATYTVRIPQSEP